MKAPLPLLIIVTVAILGITSVGMFALSAAQRYEDPNAPRIDFSRAKKAAATQTHNLPHLLGKRKRAFLVSNDLTFPCPPEHPAPFSVNPRPDSVLFTL